MLNPFKDSAFLQLLKSIFFHRNHHYFLAAPNKLYQSLWINFLSIWNITYIETSFKTLKSKTDKVKSFAKGFDDFNISRILCGLHKIYRSSYLWTRSLWIQKTNQRSYIVLECQRGVPRSIKRTATIIIAVVHMVEWRKWLVRDS